MWMRSRLMVSATSTCRRRRTGSGGSSATARSRERLNRGAADGPVPVRRSDVEEPNHRHRRLLRPRRERPRSRRTAEQRDEIAPLHSRTSLARAMNTSDKETPWLDTPCKPLDITRDVVEQPHEVEAVADQRASLQVLPECRDRRNAALEQCLRDDRAIALTPSRSARRRWPMSRPGLAMAFGLTIRRRRPRPCSPTRARWAWRASCGTEGLDLSIRPLA
jgi:hypothetical protein